MTEQTIKEGKKYAIISYITIFGVIIAFYKNADNGNNPFTSFHNRQALGLWLTFFALGYIIGNFDSIQITSSWYIFFSVLLCFGVFNAVKGNTYPIPLVGKLYQKLFANLGK